MTDSHSTGPHATDAPAADAPASIARITDSRITLPSAPQPAPPFRFPVVAATVPIVASVAIWLITGSMFALIFAALGPLAATGSYIDSRVTARKNRRAEAARFAQQVSATQLSIDAYHGRESVDLAERTPSALIVVRDVHTDSARWLREPRDVLPVHLGYGSVRSNLVIDGVAAPDRPDASTDEQFQHLTERAAHLHNASIAVNARLGIAIFGNELIALSIARALAIQLARALSPTTSWVRLRGVFGAEGWGSHLPHRVLRSDGGVDAVGGSHERASVHWGQLGEDLPCVSISVVSRQEQVPSGHRIIIRATDHEIAVVSHPDKHQRRKFDPSFLGREQALGWARVAQGIASRDGLASNDGAVPESLQFNELLTQLAAVSEPNIPQAHSLESRPAAGSHGPIMIDLVSHGPHAIVGGTTGSGKSELLIAWVLAMAAESSPSDVTFLLVDFKGGSAFDHLIQLPHTVGIITDLDKAAADRAFASLRAELQYRERALAQAGARDISELETLPRLVIVIDEFAAMMADYPQLHTLFSDIAARGRSLGVHLILCTQRPSGVVRDALLANADLRISLRVNNGADSSAVIGSDRAAELHANAKGRAWVAHGSSSAELVQFALATPDDATAVAERWPGNYSQRRPWCEPLEQRIPLRLVIEMSTAPAANNTASAARNTAQGNNARSPHHTHSPHLNPSATDIHTDRGTDSVFFGLTDLPDEQRRGLAQWSPVMDGNVLIVGAPGSGKSVAIATFSAASPEEDVLIIAGGPEPTAFWDVLAELHSQLDHSEPGSSAPGDKEDGRTVLMLDDLDALVSRYDDDYRLAVLDKLTRLLREGPAHNIWIVASAQRITPALQSLVQLIPNTLRLRLGSRQDFVLAGGVSADFDPSLPPGGGVWKGVRAQVALSDSRPPVARPPVVVTLKRTQNLAIATSRPGATAAALTAAGWQVRNLEGAPGAERELLVAATTKPVALIGSLDEWQSRWGALALLRAHTTVLLDGCTPSDYRQLTRARELPPPLAAGSGHYWRVAEGRSDRVRMPH